MLKKRIPTAQLIAAAESFASVSRFADACYRYYFYHDKASRELLLACLAAEFAKHLKGVPLKYHASLVRTVLIEITYPIKGNAHQAFTVKERACCLGISRRQYYRIPFDTAIDNIIGNIKGIALVVAGKVQVQLGKKFQVGY